VTLVHFCTRSVRALFLRLALVGWFACAAWGQVSSIPQGGGGGAPTGAAGGVLTGTYPNPGLAASTPLTGTPTATTPASSDNSTRIATTSFVQGLIASLSQAIAVSAATTTILPFTPVYANGTAGVGATLTAGSNGVLTIDGYTVLANDRVLINNQASSFQNGVYTVTTLGTASVHYVLTRASDFQTPGEINGSGAIPALNGTANNNTLWVLNVSIATIGTDAINYNLGAASPVPAITITNAASTGTAVNKLVKLTGAPSSAVVTAITDTSGAIGICSASCGTSGAATVLEAGPATCIFDAATTAGDYVQLSSSVAGDCHDAGASFPPSGQVVGRVLTTNAAGGSFTLLLFSPDVVVKAAAPVHGIGATFDGAGSALTTGTKSYVTAPYACTVSAWNMTVDTGTATIDVWKIATGTAVPTVSNTITASALPAIASGTALHSTTLTGWTTSVSANDIFAFNVNAVASATRASVVLQCQ
jgi:hypothetical protein